MDMGQRLDLAGVQFRMECRPAGAGNAVDTPTPDSS